MLRNECRVLVLVTLLLLYTITTATTTTSTTTTSTTTTTTTTTTATTTTTTTTTTTSQISIDRLLRFRSIELADSCREPRGGTLKIKPVNFRNYMFVIPI